jgi:hypothetical protein
MDAPALTPPVLSHLRTADTVVRAELGLTAYLAEPRLWATEGAARVLRAFLELVPSDGPSFYTTSLLTSWRVRGRDPAALADALSARGLVHDLLRHHFFFRLADDPGAPGLGFSYTEIDPARATRSAVLELTLPAGTDPARLLALAETVARTGPLHALVGGWAARWNPRWRALAFSQLHRWCRRFLGLDVQVPEEMAWLTPEALPGAGWLTLVGEPVARARGLELAALAAARWRHPVRAASLPAGLLLQAGPAPSLGDVNALGWPAPQAEVARALADHLVPDPPAFWGDFHDRGDTKRWFRRLLAPQDWE